MKKVSIFFIFLFLSATLFAQKKENCEAGWSNGWCWGKDPNTSKTKNALYSDAMKSKDYAGALKPLYWLFENTPNLNKSIYINGEKIYKKLINKEKDKEKLSVLQDSLLSVYDKRIAVFGEKEKIIQKKGLVSYNYLIQRGKEQYEPLYKLYDEIVSLNKENTYRANLIFYIKMSTIMYKLKKIDEDALLSNYDKVDALMEQVLSGDIKDEEKANWEKTRNAADDLISTVIDFDCVYAQEKLAHKLENEDDIASAKKTIKYMIKCSAHEGNCTESPLFLKAAKNIYKSTPNVGLGLTIAKRYLQQKELPEAKKWYEKVIVMAKEKDKNRVGELYIDMAKIYMVEKNNLQARKYALQAVKNNEDKAKEAYELIGDLYMMSGKECENINPVKNRAVYLAAYDMYSRAESGKKMKSALAQFPSAADIHIATMHIGDMIEIDCWVNTKTIVRSRPE